MSTNSSGGRSSNSMVREDVASSSRPAFIKPITSSENEMLPKAINTMRGLFRAARATRLFDVEESCISKCRNSNERTSISPTRRLDSQMEPAVVEKTIAPAERPRLPPELKSRILECVKRELGVNPLTCSDASPGLQTAPTASLVNVQWASTNRLAICAASGAVRVRVSDLVSSLSSLSTRNFSSSLAPECTSMSISVVSMATKWRG
jgi:hypothetical protein